MEKGKSEGNENEGATTSATTAAMTATAPARRPGPKPGVATRKFNVMIEEELAEWAKSQPGGLSEMVRRLLKAERAAQS